jgi:phosphoribosylaminoimidazole-succinocarboxamide synthase
MRGERSPLLSQKVLLTCPPLGWPIRHKGKVREVFDLDDRLLLVATDRLSAFDVVFPDGIPGKGRVLNQLSALWFEATRHLVENHYITQDLSDLGLSPEIEQELTGRSMIVTKCRRIDVECVVRGYLAGSGWKEYSQNGTVAGIPLPAGLSLNSELPEPIFTPALKNDTGHDVNVSLKEVYDRFGSDLTDRIVAASFTLYQFASAKAAQAGIILADTKFEFGLLGEELLLIDEAFTPDSSRYWPLEAYATGKAIDSLDKQPIRDYVESIGWNKQPPAPKLPPEVIGATSRRYDTVLHKLTALLAV